MDGRVILVEGFFEGVRPDPVEFAETLAKSIEHRVGPFFGTTLNNHVDKLNLDGSNNFFIYATKLKKAPTS